MYLPWEVFTTRPPANQLFHSLEITHVCGDANRVTASITLLLMRLMRDGLEAQTAMLFFCGCINYVCTEHQLTAST